MRTIRIKNSRGYNAPFLMDGLSVGSIGGGFSGSLVPDLLASAEIPSGHASSVGLPYQVIITLFGLLVATLSVTGVIVWLKKKRV